MAILSYQSQDWKRKQPLKYQTGGEKRDTIVIYSSTVDLDSDSRRLIWRGQVLLKITSGLGINKYGPYSKTASDGRQTLAVDLTRVAVEGEDVVLGDKAIGAWFMDCAFDMSEMTTNGISMHGSSLTSLKAALVHCMFLD